MSVAAFWCGLVKVLEALRLHSGPRTVRKQQKTPRTPLPDHRPSQRREGRRCRFVQARRRETRRLRSHCQGRDSTLWRTLLVKCAGRFGASRAPLDPPNGALPSPSASYSFLFSDCRKHRGRDFTTCRERARSRSTSDWGGKAQCSCRQAECQRRHPKRFLQLASTSCPSTPYSPDSRGRGRSACVDLL